LGKYLFLWGDNAYGQLGLNNTTSQSFPTQVYGNTSQWTQISAGANFMGALKVDGTLWVWGRNSYGELGQDNLTMFSSPVQLVSGVSNWIQINCGRGNFGGIGK
jgi:alpha-tubulin suppressor-like RCC1 family protein